LNHTPQRGANEGNAADGALMVDQGFPEDWKKRVKDDMVVYASEFEQD